MKSIDNIKGVILLGGKSSRMGQDKKFLLYKNKTFLEHTINLLQNISLCNEIILSGTSNNLIENLKINSNNIICLEDSILNCGPISGVLQSLSRVEHNQWLIFLPVDMPLLTKEVINFLLKNFNNYKEKFEAIYFYNYVFPFLLKNTINVNNIVKKNINKKVFSLKILLETINSYQLKIDSILSYNLSNINTPNDYSSL